MHEYEINTILHDIIGTQIPLDYGSNKMNNSVLQMINTLQLNTSTTVDFLKKITPKCKDLLLSCTWEGVSVNCTDVSKYIKANSKFIGEKQYFFRYLASFQRMMDFAVVLILSLLEKLCLILGKIRSILLLLIF